MRYSMKAFQGNLWSGHVPIAVTWCLRIVSERAIREFAGRYADAAASLEHWRRVVRGAAWKSGAEVQATLPDADQVGDKTVFNIARNRYRLIAWISFRRQAVYVKGILTHREYDKGEWKK